MITRYSLKDENSKIIAAETGEYVLFTDYSELQNELIKEKLKHDILMINYRALEEKYNKLAGVKSGD
jgi:hypothetical protein